MREIHCSVGRSLEVIVVQHNLSLKLNGIPLGLNVEEREGEKRQEKTLPLEVLLSVPAVQSITESLLAESVF